MKIGGLNKFSLIDYPGMICAIVFTQGCSFNCPYCHNPELSDPKLFGECIPEKDILTFLEKRRGKLDAVSVTGGEPTEQPDLIDFIKKIKAMGYLVKIDTNGSHPEVLTTLINTNLIDYIAMDVKAPFKKYQKVAGAAIDTSTIRQSIKLIKESMIPYEFRTTVVKSQLDESDLIAIGGLIRGAQLYVLQKFIPTKTLNPSYMKKKTLTDEEFERVTKKLKRQVRTVVIR